MAIGLSAQDDERPSTAKDLATAIVIDQNGQ